MPTVLVIDDDPELASLLAEYLGRRGLEVFTVPGGRAGLERVAAGGIDLVVLDVMMPGMDGFQVLQELRRSTAIPVVMLTARGDDMDRIVGLEMGADDYLPKPFNPRELLARIRAVLRRAHGGEDAGGALTAAGIRVDGHRYEASVDGRPLDLTTTEFEILRALVAAAGRVIPRERLMEVARGPEWSAFERTVDAHISHLRRKLGDDPRHPRRIKTVRGVGYLVPEGGG